MKTLTSQSGLSAHETSNEYKDFNEGVGLDVKVKVPYRVPLVGGFTDFPIYYRVYTGETIAFTINAFVTITVRENAYGGIDIRTTGDMPSKIGLGSSGSYHAALVLALSKVKNQKLSKQRIAKLAYDLETGINKHATGKQDSVACLYRGFSRVKYLRDDSVQVGAIWIPNEWRAKLNVRLLLFDTGYRRSASDSIRDIFSKEKRLLLNEIAKLPQMLADAWDAGDMDFLGKAITLQEHYRRQLSPTCRSTVTDQLLATARECGAGARLIGAGLGCLLCYCTEDRQDELRAKLGISELKSSVLW